RSVPAPCSASARCSKAASGQRPSGRRRRFAWPSCRQTQSTSLRSRSSPPRIAARPERHSFAQLDRTVSAWIDAVRPTVRQIYALAAAPCEKAGEEFPETREAASELIERLRIENGHPAPRLHDIPIPPPRRRRGRGGGGQAGPADRGGGRPRVALGGFGGTALGTDSVSPSPPWSKVWARIEPFGL